MPLTTVNLAFKAKFYVPQHMRVVRDQIAVASHRLATAAPILRRLCSTCSHWLSIGKSDDVDGTEPPKSEQSETVSPLINFPKDGDSGSFGMLGIFHVLDNANHFRKYGDSGSFGMLGQLESNSVASRLIPDNMLLILMDYKSISLKDRKQITHDSELFTSSLAILPFILYGSLVDAPEQKPKTIVDVGCGIGGSSRYLARKYGAECHDITLSPVQAERAHALAADQGLSDKIRYHRLLLGSIVSSLRILFFPFRDSTVRLPSIIESILDICWNRAATI
ncbi:hypothetical protein L2E82_40752 [Cichorium intybus]|uniref:Uncharacterized protein n=1 Tax=Cichorium intybus TaxID=13427 RepID=A0ACB9AM77_CICIN|nr:hypothetical protein L2E82_40752 [Cichorium intybus]